MKCVICGKEIKEWGNNALPLADGTCCNECNNHVITARILLDKYKQNPVAIEQLTKGISEEPKVGAKLLIINMKGEPNYFGKSGTITHIDDIGQIHGDWGGCAVIPNEDVYYIYGGKDNG